MGYMLITLINWFQCPQIVQYLAKLKIESIYLVITSLQFYADGSTEYVSDISPPVVEYIITLLSASCCSKGGFVLLYTSFKLSYTCMTLIQLIETIFENVAIGIFFETEAKYVQVNQGIAVIFNINAK